MTSFTFLSTTREPTDLAFSECSGRLKALKMLGACPYQMLEGQMEFTPIDQAAHAMVLLASPL